MPTIPVCYGTGEGQTAKVADRIVAVLGDRGHEATAIDAADPPAGLDVPAFDAVVVGSSIHVGNTSRRLRSSSSTL